MRSRIAPSGGTGFALFLRCDKIAPRGPRAGSGGKFGPSSVAGACRRIEAVGNFVSFLVAACCAVVVVAAGFEDFADLTELDFATVAAVEVVDFGFTAVAGFAIGIAGGLLAALGVEEGAAASLVSFLAEGVETTFVLDDDIDGDSEFAVSPFRTPVSIPVDVAVALPAVALLPGGGVREGLLPVLLFGGFAVGEDELCSAVVPPFVMLWLGPGWGIEAPGVGTSSFRGVLC